MTTEELREEMKRIGKVIEQELISLQKRAGIRIDFEIELINTTYLPRNGYSVSLSATTRGTEMMG